MEGKNYLRENQFNVQKNEEHKRDFLAGDIVSHRDWGVGYVVKVGSGPQTDIIVDFPGKPGHQMSSQLAKNTLSKLPADGLESLLLRDRDKVAQWSQSAPLKLIGAVLADFGKEAKPAALRTRLEGRLLSVKWESWWKRVQPVIKQSPYFRVRYDGSYMLASPVEQIPESPLPPSPKKSKPAKISSAQAQQLASRLEVGEIGFEGLKGAKTLRLVAREIVQRSVASSSAHSALIKALAGPVLPVRVILDECSKLEQPQELIEALVEYVSHIQVLVATVASEKGKKVSGPILSKLRLLEDATRRLATYQQLEEDPLLIATFVKVLLQLALMLWRKEMSGWRSQSLGYISNAVAILAGKQSEVFAIAGEHLARDENSTFGRVAIAESLLAKVAAKVRPEAVDRFLMGSLSVPSEFTEGCFLHNVKKEQQLLWVSSALPQVLLSCNTSAIDALARLLLRIEPRLEPQELKTYLELVIVVASMSPKTQAILNSVIKDRLKERLDSIELEISDLTTWAKPNTVLDAVEGAWCARLAEERQKARDVRASLESEVKGLQQALETTRAKSARLEEMVAQLKSSYRLPEHWASFQGKKGILESLVVLYQEAFLARNVDAKTAGWMLQRLQNLLQKEGVSSFGQVESHTNFAPALHEFIPGFEGAGKEVQIKCPGFEWNDPAGNEIILARAKVIRREGVKWDTA